MSAPMDFLRSPFAAFGPVEQPEQPVGLRVPLPPDEVS